jgi:hypothetical protein
MSSPVEAFFERYGADFDRNKPAASQFQRLGKMRRWDNRAWACARHHFNDAMAREFNILYGEDVDVLETWQSLCEEVHVIPAPDTISECKAVRDLFSPSSRMLSAEPS